MFKLLWLIPRARRAVAHLMVALEAGRAPGIAACRRRARDVPQPCPKASRRRAGVRRRKPPGRGRGSSANASKKRGFIAARVAVGGQTGSEPRLSAAEEACGGSVFVPGPTLLMRTLEPGAALFAAAPCGSWDRFLHTQLFPALAAVSLGLNTVTNDKQFKVKCLDIG